MASIEYEKIFNQFFGFVDDVKFTEMSDDDLSEVLTELLHKSVYSSYVYHLFSSVDTDDITQTLHYVMSHEVHEEADKQFLITALAKWMKYEWLSPQLNNVVNTSQFFGGKEQKFYSQSAHISELRALTEQAYKEARDFIRDRTYINNDYLAGGTAYVRA